MTEPRDEAEIERVIVKGLSAMRAATLRPLGSPLRDRAAQVDVFAPIGARLDFGEGPGRPWPHFSV